VLMLRDEWCERIEYSERADGSAKMQYPERMRSTP